MKYKPWEQDYEWVPLSKFKGPVKLSAESDYLIWSMLMNSCSNPATYLETEVNVYAFAAHCTEWRYIGHFKGNVFILLEVWCAPS